MRFECRSDHAANPFVEIAEHNARTTQFGMTDDSLIEQTSSLLSMFEKCGSEVHVENVQHRSVHLDIRTQAAPLFTPRCRDVEIAVDLNRKSAQDDIAITSAF